jgi:hypothetical protein
MTDLEPEAQDEAQQRIQQVVDQVAAQHQGDDVEATRAALARALEEAGLPEQPEKWVSDTGAEIAAGRRVVVDRAIRDEDDPRRNTVT